jgi:indole-3-glycerol phosphate synthase
MSILDEIFAHKREEVARQKRARSLPSVRAEAEQSPLPRDFLGSLMQHSLPGRSSETLTIRQPALIAEIKRASPSRGLLLPDFDPLRLARLYQKNGAAAISILTDERYFQGHLDYLRQIANQREQNLPGLPLLRKDFICDPYQLFQARAAGADAVLLIVAGLQVPLLCELHGLALDLGMAPLVEVHTLDELEIALTCDPILIGINNRNLHDFSVSLETTLRLRRSVPSGICLVAESGIHTSEDVALLASAGVDAVLVGEALVTSGDIAEQVRKLAGKVEVHG